MSADRWGTCPKCGDETLREEWEIGIINGKFQGSYAATCMDKADMGKRSPCGFEFVYRCAEETFK